MNSSTTVHVSYLPHEVVEVQPRIGMNEYVKRMRVTYMNHPKSALMNDEKMRRTKFAHGSDMMKTNLNLSLNGWTSANWKIGMKCENSRIKTKAKTTEIRRRRKRRMRMRKTRMKLNRLDATKAKSMRMRMMKRATSMWMMMLTLTMTTLSRRILSMATLFHC